MTLLSALISLDQNEYNLWFLSFIKLEICTSLRPKKVSALNIGCTSHVDFIECLTFGNLVSMLSFDSQKMLAF